MSARTRVFPCVYVHTFTYAGICAHVISFASFSCLLTPAHTHTQTHCPAGTPLSMFFTSLPLLSIPTHTRMSCAAIIAMTDCTLLVLQKQVITAFHQYKSMWNLLPNMIAKHEGVHTHKNTHTRTNGHTHTRVQTISGDLMPTNLLENLFRYASMRAQFRNSRLDIIHQSLNGIGLRPSPTLHLHRHLPPSA